jgi:hypothetical protein
VFRNPRLVLLFAASISVAAVLTPTDAIAQRRVARRTLVRPAVVVSSGVFYPRLYYDSFLYHPFFYGWYGPYAYPPPYYRYGWYYDNTGSARIQVRPRDAQVFVDGYFVGIVDDFDGVFQRLHVQAGEHELQIHREGYRTIRQKVLFRPGATLKLTYAMEPQPAGEPNEPRPTPDPHAPVPSRRGAPVPAPYRGGEQSGFGTLALRVQPADATILIDGERWEGPESDSRISIELLEGPHRVEIRKDGYRTYTTTVRVRRGETVTLNVSLTVGQGAGGATALSRRF